MKKSTDHTEIMLGITTGFMLLYWWLENDILLYIAIGVGLTGIFFKPGASWIANGWRLLTRALGFVNSRLILGAIFFLILWPIAALSRLGRKDSMNLKGGGKSFYTIRDHVYKPEDLENPW
ncbi:MAG: hypothetical protein KDC34_05510 [Saprospiraceae bacterium]|nr:hypothetical protein [Saprospiraceae bacterium]